MSFTFPTLLLSSLPLVALPLVIHLVNRHRHRTKAWAAMMFLLSAKRMTRGMARLRQILIMLVRMLAIAVLLFAVSRPLASGWLGLMAGGQPDTVILLLDRSASMQQWNLDTRHSKRQTGLEKLSSMAKDLGQNTRVVLIDSATNQPTEIDDPNLLPVLPETELTETTADIPAMLQTAGDYIADNQTGRTDM